MKTLLISLSCSLSLFCILSFTPYSASYSKTVKGNGKIISKDININNYSKIEVSNAANLVYEQKTDEPAYLRVEIDQNLEEYLILKVENNKLVVSSKSNLQTNNYKVYTNSKELIDINSSGAANVILKGKIASSSLKTDCSGASDLKADNLQCSELSINCSGASKINLTGTTKTSSIVLSGASYLKAEQLQIKNLDITCSGASSAKIFVTERLKTNASGASSIKYKGNPEIIKKSISGASSIKQY